MMPNTWRAAVPLRIRSRAGSPAAQAKAQGPAAGAGAKAIAAGLALAMAMPLSALPAFADEGRKDLPAAEHASHAEEPSTDEASSATGFDGVDAAQPRETLSANAAQEAPGVRQDASAPAELTALKTVSRYDEEIRALGSVGEVSGGIVSGTPGEKGGIGVQTELLLLQRFLVDAAGYDKLLAWANEDADNAKFLQWLLTDYETLQLYVTGGRPGGRDGRGSDHVQAISQLKDLMAAHPEDLKDDVSDRRVYRTMMVSAALGVNDFTRLWVGNKNTPANPVKRYEIIKTFRAHAEHYRFQKDIFDALPVETMRWIFENRIADEELPWLANYTLDYTKADGSKLDEGGRLNPYTFVEYNSAWPYTDETFYNEHDLFEEAKSIKKPAGEVIPGGWSARYRFVYDDENFPNENEGDPFYLSHYTGEPPYEYQRLWMPFERGGVCGAIGKTSENLSGIVGLPGATCGQPAHAAAVRYQWIGSGDDRRKGYTVQNDAGYGWLQLQVPEENHKLCGWEEVHRQNGDGSDGSTRWGGGPYILLAQDVLDDMDGLTKVFELRALADAQASDEDKLVAIDAALEAQPFNQDAMLAKVGLYEKKKASAEEWRSLAEEVAAGFAWYPLPMHSFMKLIEQKASSAGIDVVSDVETLRLEALTGARQATSDDVADPDACKQVAGGLLNKQDAKLATFSFDGEHAGEIVLGPQLSNSVVEWEYAVDGSTWVGVSGNRHSYKLPEEDVAKINASDDILVRFKGASFSTTIDITEGVKPEGYTLNHPERRIYTKDGKPLSSIEAQIDGEWVALGEDVKLPEKGEFSIRSAATGTVLASKGDQTQVCSFDSRYDVEGSKAVPASELKVNGRSSEHSDGERAALAVDGYLGADQFWHNNWSGDENAYITIDLGRERTITDIDYWNHGWNTHGMVWKGEISFAGEQSGLDEGAEVPAERFSQPAAFSFDWSNEGGPYAKNGQTCRLTLDEPTKARYVRIRATEAVTDDKNKPPLFTASEFQFYEDADATGPGGGDGGSGGDGNGGSDGNGNGGNGNDGNVHVEDIYSDVAADAWYAGAALWAYEEGVMTGVAPGVFGPEEAVTRGMLATTLHRMAGTPAAQDAGFQDVDRDAYYAEAVDWAADAGVVTGYGDDGVLFGPEDAMTREQLAAMLFRYADKVADVDTSKRADLSAYADADDMTPYARDAVSWAVAEGLIRGIADSDVLAPVDGATRAQVATVLMRFDALMGGRA